LDFFDILLGISDSSTQSAFANAFGYSRPLNVTLALTAELEIARTNTLGRTAEDGSDARLEEALNATRDALEEKGTLQAQVEGLTSLSSQQAERIHVLEEKIKELEADRDQRPAEEETVQQLRREKEELLQKVSELNWKVEQLTGEASRAEEEKRVCEQQRDVLAVQLKERAAEIERLSGDLATASQNVHSLKARLSSVRECSGRLNGKVVQAQDETRHATERYETLAAERQVLQHDYQDLLQRKQVLEEQAKGLEEQNSKLNDMIVTLRHERDQERQLRREAERRLAAKARANERRAQQPAAPETADLELRLQFALGYLSRLSELRAELTAEEFAGPV